MTMMTSLKWIGVLLCVIALYGGWLLLRTSTGRDHLPAPSLPEPESPQPAYERRVIGTSVEHRDIEAYTFGMGDTHLLFVGGIHGGYEWNSVVLAYQAIEYFEAQMDALPTTVRITIIPVLNPDGVYEIIGKEGRFAIDEVPDGPKAPGRFNANGVDLNRNFNCKWQPESTWRGRAVSAGTAPFSEPEAAALRDFVIGHPSRPTAVIFWHSKANAVYASECEDGILPETLNLMSIYANASSYQAVASFDAYPVTGDAEGWLASIGIPAITVELKTHETIEWEQNLAGIQALLAYYAHNTE